MQQQPDTATVVAARDGDPAAVDRLVAGYLPLVYTIVGRSLDGLPGRLLTLPPERGHPRAIPHPEEKQVSRGGA